MLQKRTYTDTDTGETLSLFFEFGAFEVDGIKYVPPYRSEYDNQPMTRRSMFVAKSNRHVGFLGQRVHEVILTPDSELANV